jgi:hypothetical protein
MNLHLAKHVSRIRSLGRRENPEVGPHLRLGVVALGFLAFLAILIWLSHIAITVYRCDRAVFTYDSAEYAIAGRQFSRTGALNTTYVDPGALYGKKSPPFVFIVGHPFVPIFDGVMFLIGGERPALTLILPGLSYVMLVCLAAAFAFQLSRSRAMAMCVGCAVAFHSIVLFFASDGLSEMPYTAVWIAALMLLWQMREQPRPFILGVVLGVAHFIRPVILPLIPIWLVAGALMVPGRRRRTIVMMMAGFLPWIAMIALHRYIATGDPMADVGPSRLLTYLTPELTPYRLRQYVDVPSPLAYVSEHPRALIEKIFKFGPAMAQRAFMVAGFFIGMLFLIHLMSPAKRAGEKIFRISLALSLVLLIGLVTITVPSQRYFFPFLPLYIIMGLTELYLLMRARGWPELRTVGICAITVVLFASHTMSGWWNTWREEKSNRSNFTEREWVDFGGHLRKVLPHRAVVASDAAPWLAWYADRPSVLLPATPAQLDPLHKRLVIDAVVLTNEGLLSLPGNEEWQSMFLGQEAREEWTRADSVSFGKLKALILLPAQGDMGQ